MTVARTILAVLIAISVTLLPVARAAAFKPKPADMTQMADMSAAMGDMSAAEPMDCCPPDTNPCNGMDDCLSMAGCPFASLILSVVSPTTIVFPPMLAGIMPRLTADTLDSQSSSPPFRPPRV